MSIRKLLIIGVFFLSALVGRGQGCTTLGQTPATAFPVCGSAIFKQASVPPCVNGNVTAPCSAGTGNVYQDLNPYWYKFTCFVSGTLQLTITPKDQGDDYDWQIFDVTGHSPADVYGSSKLLVACNWSGLTGTTGTSSSATSLNECGSTNTSNPPKYSKLPNLIQGHNYLLLISHFSGDSQSGYDLSFEGGSGSITDTLPPTVKSVEAECDGSRVRVILNKKMRCSTLAADGSDFAVDGTPNLITGATGNSCSNGFDMDTIQLTMNGALAPGSYTLRTRKANNNTHLLDNCDAPMPDDIQVPFEFQLPQQITADSLTPPTCSPLYLQLVFKKRIKCSTIASDGSDFTLSGTSAISITGASAVCDNDGESYSVTLRLSAPILTAGNYIVKLFQTGGNSNLIDECGLRVLAGNGLPFSTKDTVDAEAFANQVKMGCIQDTIAFSYPNINGVDQWTWVFENEDTSHLQDPERRYAVFGTKTVQLTISNGFCRDSTSATVPLNNAINAAFEAPNILCPKDAAMYRNNSTGTLNSWTWDFGDGAGDQGATPGDHLYPETGVETKYKVLLIVGNSIGCKDTAVQLIDVLRSCYIAVPSGFTPNGDGLNDFLYPLNAYKADNLEFRVYNRYGQMVFESTNWLQKWDGTIAGHPQPPGTFVWMLRYTDRDTGKKIFQKGTSLLIR